MTSPTHSALVRRAAKWLRGRPCNCRVVLHDVHLIRNQEQPDVIGWGNSGRSILVECKASRIDLRVDRNKPFRRNGMGMGSSRYLFCTPEVVAAGTDPVDLSWGIVTWPGNGTPRLIRRPRTPARDQSRGRADLAYGGIDPSHTEGWGRQMFLEDSDPGHA